MAQNLATKDTTELERTMLVDAGKAVEGGIPKAMFIENVENFCAKLEPIDPAEILQALQNLYSKYQHMKRALNVQRMSLKTKIPDLKQGLDMVKKIDTKRKADEVMSTRFMLADNVYVKAEVTPKKMVALWLGANVMMEYTIEEALELLAKNLKVAEESLGNVTEDLENLQDQSTTTKVNIARVHNHNVKIRRERREQEAEQMKNNQVAVEA